MVQDTSLFVKPAQDPAFLRVVAAAIMRKRPSGNVAQLADAGDVMGPSGNVAQLADAGDVKEADDLMDEIRALGYVPKEHGADAPLALRVRKARKKGEFGASQIEEMRTLNAQHAEKQRTEQADRIMDEIRALGHIPQQRGEHDALYQKYNKAKKNGLLTSEQTQEAELLTESYRASIAQC